MHQSLLLAAVAALLAACATVPEPKYETDHPANAAAAPAPPEPQSSTLSSYHAFGVAPGTPSDNAMDRSQMKRGAPKDANPLEPREGDHANH